MLDKIHHITWPLALVACVAIVAFFWAPQRHDATQVAVTPRSSEITHEIQAGFKAVEQVAASRGSVPFYERPAVAAVQKVIDKRFGGTGTAAWLHAAGTQNTIESYHFIAPSPMPSATDLYTTAYNADAAAIKNTTMRVQQDPVPPSRIQTAYLSDATAGILYAVRRRGQWDLDVGYTQGNGYSDATAGIGWRLHGTQAGVYVGPIFNFTTRQWSGAAGLTVAF